MKKFLYILVFSISFLLTSQTTFAVSCDQVFEWTVLRYDKGYRFYDTWNNNTSKDTFINKRKIRFIDSGSSTELNTSSYLDPGSAFTWTKSLIDNNFKVSAGTSMRIIETGATNWRIKKHPSKRTNSTKENHDFMIYYQVDYDKTNNYPDAWDDVSHVECEYYSVSWCGDWVKDSWYETCDPNDPNKNGWWNGWCSSSCESVNIATSSTCDSISSSPTTWVAPFTTTLSCSWTNANSYKISCWNWATIDAQSWKCVYATVWDYDAFCSVNSSISSNSCKTKISVTAPTPAIQVEKYSWNTNDLDWNKSHDQNDDSQTVQTWALAVFKIEVNNVWNQDLNTITLNDTLAPNCDKTDAQTKAIIKTIWNKDEILNVWESFNYTCDKSDTTSDYENRINVRWIWTISWVNNPVTDTDWTWVRLVKPEIRVIKTDANPNDLDKSSWNDSQTVNYLSWTTFRINVKNIGSESLKNIILNDTLVPECNKTDSQTKLLIKTTWNNNEFLDVWEEISYDCSQAQTKNSYTNTIVVSWNWTTSNVLVTDTDTSNIVALNLPLACKATISWVQNSEINSSTSWLCANPWEKVTNFSFVQNWNTINYAWWCSDWTSTYTWWNCNASYTATYSWGSSGWSGWWTYRCNDMYVSSNTVKCIWNSYAKSFWVICDTSNKLASANNIEQFKSFSKDLNNNNYAEFSCSSINKPVCFAYNNTNVTSYNWQAWRTSNACKQIPKYCWNGRLDPGDECEAPVNDKWIIWSLPSFCSAVWDTCKLSKFSTLPISDWNLSTQPNEGEIGFVWMYDMVVWHKQNLSSLNKQIYIWNRSDYSFNNTVFNWICLTTNNVAWQRNTWDSLSNLWLTRHCSDINSNFYPGQKIYLKTALNDIVADKSKVDWPNYEDNNLVITIRTAKDTSPYSKVLNWSDHLTGKFRVRVAKPAIKTTWWTSFTKAWVSADSKKIAEDDNINIKDWDSNDIKNNNDVWVWTKSSSSNTVSDTNKDIIKQANKYNSWSKLINNNLSSDLDVTNISWINNKYNWLSNVFIIKNANVVLGKTNLNLFEPTTYIIDWWNLVINDNISANQNIAFVVKNWWNIKIWANVAQIMWTYIVLDNWKINWEESEKQLLVKWSLYGDISNLVKNRYKVTQNNWELTFGTVVSFGSTVFQKPAPMVTSFINTYLKTSKIAK